MTDLIPLEKIISGRRVLVLNSIRSDIRSGGNTSTNRLLGLWRSCSQMLEFQLNASGSTSVWWFGLKSFPAPIFIAATRCVDLVWLEFFSRLSPWLFLRCIFIRWRWRPEVVVLNHHSSFIYSLAFSGSKIIYVWHDVPSIKHSNSSFTSNSRRIAVQLERFFLSKKMNSLCFSFADQKILSRLHHKPSTLIPVIDGLARSRTVEIYANQWLMIGNWSRAENCEGATDFFLSFASLTTMKSDAPTSKFHIAGNGASSYLDRLFCDFPSIRALTITATSNYDQISDFHEAGLLAPILKGAGIKLKTIEAWSCGIPVIGTSQAFSGLPKEIWSQGGVQLSSPREMAELFLAPEVLAEQLRSLSPLRAYAKYQAAIHGATHHAY